MLYLSLELLNILNFNKRMRTTGIKIILLITMLVFVNACKIDNTISGSGGFFTEAEPEIENNPSMYASSATKKNITMHSLH